MSNCAYHGMHPCNCNGNLGQAVCPQCAGRGCPHCQGKGYHLGLVMTKNVGYGISIGSGVAGAIIWPMLTGGFASTMNANRKAKNMAIGFAIGAALGGVGSYAGWQMQN